MARQLDTAGIPELIAEKLKLDIDEYAIRAYWKSHRWHLGASQIGHECSRYLWYVFRWCLAEIPSGRLLRLFNRGHREEERFIEFIKGIGGEIWTHDYSQPQIGDDGNEAFPQYEMSAVQGHFGGSMDGVLKLPIGYSIEEPILAEFKTNGTGRAFSEVGERGVAVSKPMHWSQMCTYGNHWKLRYAAYFIVNKNDDDLEIQVVKLDWKHGEQMLAKAERIIRSQEPPPRLSDTPTYFKCQYCTMKNMCHGSTKPEFNCRSCINAVPAENAEWYCNVHNGIIPREFVKQGCPSYKAIVNERL